MSNMDTDCRSNKVIFNNYLKLDKTIMTVQLYIFGDDVNNSLSDNCLSLGGGGKTLVSLSDIDCGHNTSSVYKVLILRIYNNPFK